MKEKNMTALISCFARYYHYKNNKLRIYSDPLAEKILSKEECETISTSMIDGINFFNPSFIGSDKEALRYIVDNQLSPSVLGRSAFCEKMLNTEIKLGCRQYLIYASGYDTSGYKFNSNGIKVFEIDKKEIINDKVERITSANINKNNVTYIACDFTDNNWTEKLVGNNYDKNKKSFNSLLGISYYLKKEDFEKMIKNISNIISSGSSIIFDYPTYETSKESTNNELLAKGANEEMQAKYSYSDIEKILSDYNLYIYEHLNSDDMTREYFYNYNTLNPNNRITSPNGVAYCYAVKK